MLCDASNRGPYFGGSPSTIRYPSGGRKATPQPCTCKMRSKLLSVVVHLIGREADRWQEALYSADESLGVLLKYGFSKTDLGNFALTVYKACRRFRAAALAAEANRTE